MITLMLTAGNPRESQILEMAFKQRGFDVISFKPNYQNYVKLLQFHPDILIVEFPRMCTDQVHFVRLVRGHKITKMVPVIGYGDRVEPAIKKGYFGSGTTGYLERPLKFDIVLKTIDLALRKVNKSTNTLMKPAPSDREADMALIMDVQTLPVKKIEVMASHTSRFMAFPFTVAKVLSLSQDAKSGAGDLAKVIETDPVISTNILKVSNTVFFASANRTISSIKDAIVRIGFNETKRIVVSMSVMDLFDSENRHSAFDRQDFWFHSLAVAIISERLSRRLGNVNREEAFLSGLLHDFGIIMLDEFFGELFIKVLEKTSETGTLFIDTETAMLGINHNDVTALLFEKWKIPGVITETVTRQYDFHTFEGKLDAPAAKLALCVGAANILAKTLVLGSECDSFVRHLDSWVFAAFKMNNGFGKAFFEDVYRDMALYRKFLGLEDRDFSKKVERIDGSEKLCIGFANLSNEIFVPGRAFLSRQGVSYVDIPLDGKKSEYDGKLDMVMITASADTDTDAIEQLSGMVKKGNGEGPEFAPQLIIVRPGSRLPSNKKLSDASFMPSVFDLRKLEQNIMEIKMGKKVEYSEYIPPAHSAGSQNKAAVA